MSTQDLFPSAKAYEDTLVIPTYPLKKESGNPCFENQYGIAYIYPYSLLDDFTNYPIDKTYRALHIENSYLKVTVLPELGGRVYSVFDKLSNRDVFYKNKVIKFAPLALRGAFFSGGIEINFPVGHHVTTTEKINWSLKENQDGSASISFGALEHMSNMRWTVTLTLYPDRCALAQDVQIHNPSHLPGRYFYWCTPACEANDGTEFIYPFQRCRSYMWDGEVSWPNARLDLTPLGGKLETYVGVPTWPSKQMHDLIDIHREKNIINQVSIFGSKPETDYFGVWQHSFDHGYAHFANHHDIAGMKHWSWGNSGMSLMTQTSLTDDGSRYAETQCGLMENQHDFDYLPPHKTRQWREWWLPLRGLGGFTCASAELGANIKISKSEQSDRVNLTVTLCPVREYKQATIIASCNGKLLFENQADLKPEESWRLEEVIDVIAVANKQITLTVSDRNGNQILAYQQKREMNVNNTPEAVITKQLITAQDHFEQGLNDEKLERREEAMQSYNKAISIDPSHGVSHLHLGLMCARAANIEAAINSFQKAVDSGVVEANYYLGNILRLEEKMELAESFYKAIPAGTPFYSAALCGVGAIYLSRRKWDQALKNFRAAIDVDTSSPTASLYSAIALRQSGKKEKAYRLLKEATNKDPLNHIICREMSLTAPDQNEVFLYKEKLTQMLNDDKQFYIDLACFYIGLGMFEDSRLILLEAAQVWDYPILSYFLSHLFGRLGEPLEAEKWLRKAFQSNPENVFPNRLEEIKLLSNILQTKPDDAKAKYYLGNFLYAHQRYNEAIELWESALEGLKQFDVIYHNLGLAQWKKCNNPSLAMEYFEEALRLNPQNQDLYLYLDNIYSEQKQEDKRHALLEKMKQLPEPRHDVQKRIVTVLVDLDCFQEAIQRLTSEKFMPLEMDQSFRHSYVRAYLKRAQFFMKEGQVEEAIADYKHAMEYPKNVGVGKPVVGTNAEVLYYLGCAYEILRQIDNAISVWREAAKENHQQGSDLYPFILKSLDKLNIYTELGYC